MIHAVILAGGWGRRFWPKSRRRMPKQLLPCIAHRYSSVQNLFNTIKSEIPRQRIWVVTNKEHALGLRRQLPALKKENFLIEPLAKNTAAAVGLAAVLIRRTDPQAVMVVLSSDQIFGKKRQFLATIKTAARFAQDNDALLAVGLAPNRPAQEFGYLKIARSSNLGARSKKIYKVGKFIEKPSLAKARQYLKAENYLWNAGVFVWKAANILGAIRRHLPRLYSGLQAIAAAGGKPRYKMRLAREYSKFRDISLDYGILEKAHNVYTIRGGFSWQDLGTWANYSLSLFHKDKKGNLIQGLHRGVDTCNSVIFSEGKHLVSTIGVSDLIVVHTHSATLVCSKAKAQQVKKLTEILENDKHLQHYL